MLKISKQMKKEKKDVTGERYIKDENGVIKIKKEVIIGRWKCYLKAC